MLSVKVRVFCVGIGRIQNTGKVYFFCTAGNQVVPAFQAVGAADHFVYRAEAKLGHDNTQLHGNEAHVIHNIFRLSGEAATQGLVLCGNTGRTGVLVADTHHHTAHANQWASGKAEFFGAQEGRNGNVSAGHQLAVCFNAYLVPKAVG